MTSTLIYTFRTNKHLSTFRKAGIDLFVFGKLKSDLIKFQDLIQTEKPTHIIGLAEVKTATMFETRAINQFGYKGTVTKKGIASFPLHVPRKPIFPKSKNTTHTFCNWTMYKICEYTAKDKIEVSFLHFNKRDLPTLLDLIQKQDPTSPKTRILGLCISTNSTKKPAL